MLPCNLKTNPYKCTHYRISCYSISRIPWIPSYTVSSASIIFQIIKHFGFFNTYIYCIFRYALGLNAYSKINIVYIHACYMSRVNCFPPTNNALSMCHRFISYYLFADVLGYPNVGFLRCECDAIRPADYSCNSMQPVHFFFPRSYFVS